MSRESKRLTYESYKEIATRQLFVRLMVNRHADGEEILIKGVVQSIWDNWMVNANISYQLDTHDPMRNLSSITIRPTEIETVPEGDGIGWEMRNFVGDEMYDFESRPWLLTTWLMDTPIVVMEKLVDEAIHLVAAGSMAGGFEKVRVISPSDFRLLQLWSAIKQTASWSIWNHQNQKNVNLPAGRALTQFYQRVNACGRDQNRTYQQALDVLVPPPVWQ